MMTILVEKIDDPSDNLFVFFPEDTKVGVKPIRKYELGVDVHCMMGRQGMTDGNSCAAERVATATA